MVVDSDIVKCIEAEEPSGILKWVVSHFALQFGKLGGDSIRYYEYKNIPKWNRKVSKLLTDEEFITVFRNNIERTKALEPFIESLAIAINSFRVAGDECGVKTLIKTLEDIGELSIVDLILIRQRLI